ncbi:origin of replication binding protein-domain-containing protein [Powellomyces hirtus]|nr:origin of replication binding protein-domain-containing protein [Powellomyces hirtus]
MSAIFTDPSTGNRFRRLFHLGIPWFKNCDIGGAQDYVLSLLEPDQVPIKSETKRWGNMWAGVTRDKLVDIVTSDQGLYEIMTVEGKRKIYFDIDIRDGTVPMETLKATILDAFPNARMHISGRFTTPTGEPDMSLHVILSNYYALNMEAILEPLKRFCKLHKSLGFDQSVYYRNKNFKCINQSKPGKDVQKYLEGSCHVGTHLIMHDFDEDAVDFTTLPYFKKDAEDAAAEAAATSDLKAKRSAPIDIMGLPQLELPVPESFDWLTATPVDKLALLPNPPKASSNYLSHHDIWIVMMWCYQTGIDFFTFWAWNKRKLDTIPRLQKYRKAWDSITDKYAVKAGTINALLEHFYPEIRASPSTKKLQANMTIENTIMVDAEQDRYLTANHISRKCKYSYLTSPMGSNKTGAVVEWLRSWPKVQKPLMRTLWISPRITLSANTKQRLAEDGLEFVNYKEMTKRQKQGGMLSEAQHLICSIQSLHYLTRNVDVIICDEIETILDTFGKDMRTHQTHLSDNWATWLTLVKNAKKVIVMDAFPSKATTNMLQSLARADRVRGSAGIEIISTRAKPTERTFLEYETFNSWFHNILEELAAGKKLYIFTPYKKGAHGVPHIVSALCQHMKWTEGKEIIGYYADKEMEKQKLEQVETVWGYPELRVVVTNGTISVGVNFNTPDVFDAIHAFYTPQISPRDFLQGLNRIRHPKDSRMRLCRSMQASLGFVKPPIDVPKCKIFQQLQKDLEIEALAGKNYNGPIPYETFNFFAQLANITTYPADAETISKANAKYIKDLLSNAEVCFDWDKIPNMCNSSDPEHQKGLADYVRALEADIYSNKATLQARLKYQKHRFRGMFRSQDDKKLKFIWSNGLQMPSKIMEIRHTEHHIIADLLTENSATLGDVFPPTMSTSMSLDRINKAFSFHNPPEDLRCSLVSRMLETYFECPVYETSQTRKTDPATRKRKWTYTTNPRFLKLVQTCIATMTEGC